MSRDFVASTTIAVFSAHRDTSFCCSASRGADMSCINEPTSGLILASSLLIQPLLHSVQTHLTVTAPVNGLLGGALPTFWTIGFRLLRLFKIQSDQRCSLLSAGLPQNRHWRWTIRQA